MKILKMIVLTDKIRSSNGQILKLTGFHRTTYGVASDTLWLERADQWPSWSGLAVLTLGGEGFVRRRTCGPTVSWICPGLGEKGR